MRIDPRRVAVAFAAVGAFLHLYAPQAVLPMIAQHYGVGAADASPIITAGTLAVAATAPFTGALSDVLGRKRVIVAAMALLLIPATMTALADSLSELIFWRFIHGLLLPPIFAVTIAYIGDEFPPAEANGVFGIYAAFSAVGGLLASLLPSVTAIVFTLVIASTCGILTQASSTSFVAITAKTGTSAAVGLYVMLFYIGGTFGGWLPGLAYEAGGWPYSIVLVLGMLAMQAIIVAKFWK